jgi:hypothetical protein
MSALRSAGSIDQVLWEAEAILGPFPPAAEAPVPPEAAPFMTGVVATPRRLAAVALGPLIALGSHFLELLVVVQDWSFTTLRLPKAIRRAISAPGLSVGEVVLVEQSRPELIWPVDIILGVGGNAVLSECLRAFALSDHLVFPFKLGRWKPRCGSLLPMASTAPTLFPQRWSEEVALPWRSSGEPFF